MKAEPKLTQELPAAWIVGVVTLTAREVDEVMRLLPECSLQSALRNRLERARARAEELNQLDQAGRNWVEP